MLWVIHLLPTCLLYHRKRTFPATVFHQCLIKSINTTSNACSGPSVCTWIWVNSFESESWLSDSSQLSLALQNPGKVLTLLGKCTLVNIQNSWRNPIAPTKLPKKKHGVWYGNILAWICFMLSRSYYSSHSKEYINSFHTYLGYQLFQGLSSGISFTQGELVQLPRAKDATDANKILDKLQLPNWLASGEQPALCQATKGVISLCIQKYLELFIFSISRQLSWKGQLDEWTSCTLLLTNQLYDLRLTTEPFWSRILSPIKWGD